MVRPNSQCERSLPGRPDERDATSNLPQTPLAAATCGALRIFCEAVLALCPKESHQSSPTLLQEILPSLPEAFSRCSFRAPFLRDELAVWLEHSRCLIRQAKWHCGDSGDQLIGQLTHIEKHATRLVDAVSAMQLATPDAVSENVLDQLSQISDDNPSGHLPEMSQLFSFCQALTALAPSGIPSDTVVAQVFPTIHLLFQRCTPDLVHRLKSELLDAELQVSGLIELAASHSESAAEELRRGMRRSHSLAASLLDALESLYYCSLESVGEESSRVKHTVKLARDTFPPGSDKKSPSTTGSSRADICYRMGARFHREESLIAAENFYTQAIAADDHHYLAYRQRGVIRLNTGRSNEALADFTEALTLQGGDAQSLRWRADAFAAMGRFREAVMDYSRLLEQSPNAVDVRLSRAVLLRELGEQDQAARELEKIFRSGFRSARLHCERGMVWEARGETKNALAEYRAALTLTPDDPSPALALQRLEREQSPTSGKRPEGEVGTTHLPVTANHADSPEDEILELLEDAKQSPPNKSVQRQGQSAKEFLAVPKEDARKAPILPLQAVGSDTSSKQAEPALDSPGEVPPKAVQPIDHAHTAPASQELIDNAMSGQIAIDCPNCGRQSLMHWDHLKKGKVFGCPRCQEKLVVREGGRLAKVVQDAAGSWKIDAPPPLWKNRQVITGAAAASTLMFGLFFVVAFFGWQYATAREIVQVPADLKSRSNMFAKAWFAKDYQVVRMLTLPSQQGSLFAWLRNNTTSENTRGAKVQATIVKQGPQVAQVELALSAPFSTETDPNKVLIIDWHKERSGWLFAPNGGKPIAVPVVSSAKPRSFTLPTYRPRAGRP